MAKVRSPYSEPVEVPPAWLGQTVNPGQVVGVRDDLLPNFLEAGWQPADAATKKAAAALRGEDVKEEETTNVAG